MGSASNMTDLAVSESDRAGYTASNVVNAAIGAAVATVFVGVTVLGIHRMINYFNKACSLFN